MSHPPFLDKTLSCELKEVMVINVFVQYRDSTSSSSRFSRGMMDLCWNQELLPDVDSVVNLNV